MRGWGWRGGAAHKTFVTNLTPLDDEARIRMLIGACRNRFGPLALRADSERRIDAIYRAIERPSAQHWEKCRLSYVVWDDDSGQRLSLHTAAARYGGWNEDREPYPSREQLLQTLAAVAL